MAEYYLGGLQRIRYLQLIWQWCNYNNIPIYILSSNPSIGYYPNFFWELLNSVNLYTKKKHILYRGNLTKYQFIKTYLPFLCHNC